MKRLFCIVLILLLTANILTTNVFASTVSQNMQAVWIATVFNIDFPSTKNNAIAQKNEYIEKLDKLKAIGINTVVVQVRPKADALYRSDINPWSDVLTGIQGKDPGYDPMAFMIEEAHKRGMAFDAWLNPYRITTSGMDESTLCAEHPAILHPDWVISHNNALYFNPELEEVKNHIVATVKEIVENYDVDAIHFDDYFYPSNYPLPQGEGRDGVTANSRRQNINDMIERVSAAIKDTKKDVLFGISPSGIWKNNTSDPTGSDTAGNESYYSVCADVRTWIKNEWIDYVVPQIYWETGNKAADYETLVEWWANEVKGTGVNLYIGQGIYRDVVAKQIDVQLAINQNYSEVGGSFYYNLTNLLADIAGCKEKIAAFHQSTPQVASVKTSPITDDNLLKYNVETGTATASILNIRNGAGLQYNIIAKVTKGTEMTILNSETSWYNVKLSNGQVGWASIDYVKLNEMTNTATIDSFDKAELTDTVDINSYTEQNIQNQGTNILAAPRAIVGQAKNWAKNNGATDTFINLADIYWEIAPEAGVDPTVAYAQSAKETGFGKFTGIVDESFYNPCGFKSSDGVEDYSKDAYAEFSSWEVGIQAHVDHLALYAGALTYPKQSTPDPRHFPYLKDNAVTVEALEGKWAMSPEYGTQIVRMMNEIKSTNAPYSGAVDNSSNTITD